MEYTGQYYMSNYANSQTIFSTVLFITLQSVYNEYFFILTLGYVDKIAENTILSVLMCIQLCCTIV